MAVISCFSDIVQSVTACLLSEYLCWHQRCDFADLCAICISTGVLCLIVLLSCFTAELILQASWAFAISIDNSMPIPIMKLHTPCKVSVNWLCAAAPSQQRYSLSWANEVCMVLAFTATYIMQSCIQTFQSDVWRHTDLQSLTFVTDCLVFCDVQCFATVVSGATCIIDSIASGMYFTIKKPSIRLTV